LLFRPGLRKLALRLKGAGATHVAPAVGAVGTAAVVMSVVLSPASAPDRATAQEKAPVSAAPEGRARVALSKTPLGERGRRPSLSHRSSLSETGLALNRSGAEAADDATEVTAPPADAGAEPTAAPRTEEAEVPPATDPVPEPGDDPTEEPGEEPTEDPGDEPTEHPGDEPIEDPPPKPRKAPRLDPQPDRGQDCAGQPNPEQANGKGPVQHCG
jgi:hypothetical protein